MKTHWQCLSEAIFELNNEFEKIAKQALSENEKSFMINNAIKTYIRNGIKIIKHPGLGKLIEWLDKSPICYTMIWNSACLRITVFWNVKVFGVKGFQEFFFGRIH